MKKLDWEKVVHAFDVPTTFEGCGLVRTVLIHQHSKINQGEGSLLVKVQDGVYETLKDAINHPGTEIIYNGSVVKAAEQVQP